MNYIHALLGLIQYRHGLILTPMVEESVKKGETNADLVQYAGSQNI